MPTTIVFCEPEFTRSDALRRAYRASFDILAHALTQCQADRFTAALVLVGDPGGVVHFRDGSVIAVHSPGAPGLETLHTDAVRPQHLARAAMSDAAFAIAVGGIEHYVVDDTVDMLSPTSERIAPHRLLAQAAVRLAVLAASPCPVSPYRERLTPTGRAEPTEEFKDIVAHATGRRTARDIAFAIGRGVHPVTLDIARLLGADVLAIAAASTFTGRVHQAPAALRPRITPPQTAGAGSADPLPVRRPRRPAPGPGP